MNKVIKIDKELFRINKLGYIIYSILNLAFTFLPFLVSYTVVLLFEALEERVHINYYLFVSIYIVLNMIYVMSIKYGAVFDVKTTFSVGKRIRKNIINVILRNKNIRVSAVGGLLDIIDNDVEPMEYILLTHIDFIGQILYLIVTILILCRINTLVTLTIVVPFLLISLLGQYIGEKYKDKYSESRNCSIEFSSVVSDIVKNRETLQYFADNASILSFFKKKCYLRGKSRYERNTYDKIISTSIDSLYYICTTLLMIVAAKMLVNSDQSIGDFTLYISYIGFGCSYLVLLKQTIYGIKSVNSSIERISEKLLMDIDDTHSVLFSPMENEPLKDNDILFGDLQFDNFRMCSGDKEHSFIIKDNELIAITGPSGSGKTKFISCLMGYAPYEGKISICGRNINEISIYYGYSNQKIFLFDASIEDNVTVFASNINPTDSLMFANIDEEVQKWKRDNSNDTIGANGKRLSEGQRQRISIARAVCNGSNIYIFDDSFSFLDKKNRKVISEKIKQLKGIKILVSNDSNIINGADRVFYIEDECIVEK